MNSKEIIYSIEISDSYNSKEIHDFDTEYQDGYDTALNEICIFIKENNKTIGYLECYMFNNRVVENAGIDMVTFADDTEGSFGEAMGILQKKGFLDRDILALNESFFAEYSATVYIYHIAVREEYRNKGIGKWLLYNLCQILRVNYNVLVDVAIVKLYPQTIDFDSQYGVEPCFENIDPDEKESKEMYKIMKKLFESFGYKQYERTQFYIRDYVVN